MKNAYGNVNKISSRILTGTCDAIFVTEQPELIHNAEHLDDISGEERQLLRDAGQKVKDSTHHRSCFHYSSPADTYEKQTGT